jgi:hypothetical protein
MHDRLPADPDAKRDHEPASDIDTVVVDGLKALWACSVTPAPTPSVCYPNTNVGPDLVAMEEMRSLSSAKNVQAVQDLSRMSS